MLNIVDKCIYHIMLSMTFYWLQLKQLRQFLRRLPGALSTDPIVLKGLPGAQGAPTKIALVMRHHVEGVGKVQNHCMGWYSFINVPANIVSYTG